MKFSDASPLPAVGQKQVLLFCDLTEADYTPIQVFNCAVMCCIFSHTLKESCFSCTLVPSFAIKMFK